MRKCLWLFTALALSVASQATARVEEPIRYTKAQSFSTALRFLRLDNGFKVVEKDKDSGYLMFEYPGRSNSAPTSGSIEVIDRGKSVALVVNLPQMPTYHERHLADGLLKKLRADYGAPPQARKPKPVEPKASDKEKSKEERPKLPHGQSLPGQ